MRINRIVRNLPKKTLHKPESLTVQNYLEHVEGWCTDSIKVSERWASWQWFETRTIKRGEKVIHHSCEPCDPPEYHLKSIEQAKQKEQREEQRDLAYFEENTKIMWEKPWWKVW